MDSLSDTGIADQIRQLRRRLGLSQRAFGKRIGVNQQRVSQIESGAGGLTLKLLERIALATGVRLEIRLDAFGGGRVPPILPEEREEILDNIRWFSRLSPIQKIRTVEAHNEATRRLLGGKLLSRRPG